MSCIFILPEVVPSVFDGLQLQMARSLLEAQLVNLVPMSLCICALRCICRCFITHTSGEFCHSFVFNTCCKMFLHFALVINFFHSFVPTFARLM
eukprot:g70550.t1